MEPLYRDAKKWLYDSWMIPGVKELGVAFMGDFQFNPEHPEDTDMARVKSWVRWCKEHNFRILMTGDLIDPCSPSARKELNAAFARAYGHSVEAMDRGIRSVCDELIDVLEDAAGLIDGSVHGHHGWVFSDGTSSTQYIMEALGGTNLGDSGIVAYDFGRGLHAWVWLHHGSGSAVTPGGIIARGQRMAERIYADLYVYGHLHQNLAWKLPWIQHRLRSKRIEAGGSTRRILAVGGALRGFTLNRKNAFGEPEGNYVERAMLPPVSLGWGAAFFRPMYGDGRVDINVSV